MGFIAVAQTLEDLDRVLFARLADLDGLETTLQSGVLLDILAVLLEGRRADDLEVAACQGGLEDVCSVGTAFRRARADDGVQLVDKEDDVLALFDLVDRVLDAILEFAAVLGARDHAGEVAQVLRHLAVSDLQRQTFGNRGLADAGLTDQAGVVLGTAGKDLDDTAYLFIPADNGIDLAVLRRLGQIAREAVERLTVAVTGRSAVVLKTGLLFILKIRAHMIGDGLRGNAECAQIADRVAVAIGQQGDQQMLGADIAGAGACRVHHGSLHHALGTRRKIVRSQGNGAVVAVHHRL